MSACKETDPTSCFIALNVIFFYIKEIIMCHSKTTNPHLTCVEDKSEPRPQSSALLLPADYRKKDGAL